MFNIFSKKSRNERASKKEEERVEKQRVLNIKIEQATEYFNNLSEKQKKDFTLCNKLETIIDGLKDRHEYSKYGLNKEGLERMRNSQEQLDFLLTANADLSLCEFQKHLRIIRRK